MAASATSSGRNPEADQERTAFGYQYSLFQAEHSRNLLFTSGGQAHAPETPEYDLTILRLHFGRRTLKIYTKGERVLRIEAMAHNARDLRCRLGVAYFAEAVVALRQMVDRFVEVLDCLDIAFVEAELLEDLCEPGQLGAVRVGGIDMNRPRAWAVMRALLALSPLPTGFTSSELATRVREFLGDESYSPSRAGL